MIVEEPAFKSTPYLVELTDGSNLELEAVELSGAYLDKVDYDSGCSEYDY